VIAHVVLFRLKRDLAEDARRELRSALLAALREIPSIRRLQVGPRVTHGRPYERLMDVDYPFVVMLEFDDITGLRLYLDHPVHERLATQFFAAFDQALMYDFELRDGEEGLATIDDGR